MQALIQTLTLGIIAAAMIYFFAQSGEETIEVPVEDDLSELQPIADYAPIWESLMEASIDPATIGHQKPNDSARLLDISQLRQSNWQVGDKLAFEIPQTGYILETQIEETQELAPGIINVKSYPDQTMSGHILLTISPKNTFMSLFTPDGEFELIGGQQYGWLVSSRSLGGPTADDFVVIDQVRDVLEEPASKDPVMEDNE